MENLKVLSANSAAASDLQSQSLWADWAGMVASIGCAIHCAAMPFVLAYLPTLGLGWLADEGFHRWMAVICFALAASAFIPGWRRHGSFLPAIWGAAGLIILTSAAFGLEGGCCESCSSGDAVAQSPAGDADACQACDCESCQSTNDPAASLTQGSPAMAGFSITPFVPFVNPIGGLLLVVGHILNHRKTCSCQGSTCCLSEESTSENS